MLRKVLHAGLILLSILATIKICFLGLGIDEEYAVTMSYRLANGDFLFQKMWEPHQTSGILNAALIRIFLCITGGSTDYLILYLRLCGCLFQLLISIFLYRTTKKYFSSSTCFLTAVFFYNTLPKWIQSPEFSNMLVWFSVLAFLCFLRYYFPTAEYGSDKKGNPFWLIGAGVFVSCLILSYPSCILTIPVILIGMWKVQEKADQLRRPYVEQAGIFLGTCVVLGIVCIACFLRILSVHDFIYGLSQMMTDGSHSATAWSKIIMWGQEFRDLFPHILISFILAALLSLFIRGLRPLNHFLPVMLIVSLIEQIVVWLGNSRYLQRPLIYFYILYAAGCLVYLRYFRGKYQESFPAVQSDDRKRSIYSFLFWMGIVAGGAVWFSALLITNTTISVTGSYLMTGLISAVFLLDESFGTPLTVSVRKVLWIKVPMMLCLLGTTLFAKGFLVCSTEGIKDDVTMVRQKALYGPAKGIYCRYMDGFTLNYYAEMLEEMDLKQKRVLYIGVHSLIYLYGEQVICNYSTISTPTYDERLWEYWRKNPERLPELVICDTSEEQIEEIRKIVCLGELKEKKVLQEGISEIRIYEVLQEITEEMIGGY